MYDESSFYAQLIRLSRTVEAGNFESTFYLGLEYQLMSHLNVKSYFLSVLILSLCCLSFNSLADTDVHFSGTLVSEPCQLSQDSEEQVVDFGSINKGIFNNNRLTAAKSINIQLINCDVSIAENVVFIFNGEEDVSQPGFFSVTGDASGIAVMLINDNGTQIKPGQKIPAKKIINLDNGFTFYAAVYGPDSDLIIPGDFTSTLLFSMSYD